MSKFNIGDFEIELWRNAVNQAIEETQRLKKIVDSDPLTVIIDCNIQCKALLDTHKGQARLTPEFNAKVQKLARKEKRAKYLAKNFKISDAISDHSQAKWRLDQITCKYHNVVFRDNLKNKSKPGQDMSVVQETVDGVSK